MRLVERVQQIFAPTAEDTVSIICFAQFLSLMIATMASANETLGRECDVAAATTQQKIYESLLRGSRNNVAFSTERLISTSHCGYH